MFFIVLFLIKFKSLRKMKWLAIIFTSVLVSCTVTKRVHQPGYHIEWRTKTVSVTEDKSQEEGLTTSQFLPEKSLEEAQIYNEPSKTLDAFLEEEDDRTESFTEQKGIT
jgi:hypothetical protein